MEKRPALGKGLSALIPDAPEPRSGAGIEVDIDRLSPNAFQPRGQMDDARLEELAASIKSNGIIQPIVVRKVGERFQIIAGERRWRAAQKAGLLRVPVVVREVAPARSGRVLEMALIENIQRENLNADRRSARLPASDRRVRADAGGDRRRGRQGSRDGREHAPAAEAARRSARGSRLRRAVDGARPRAAGACRARRTSGALAREVIARALSVRETESLVRKTAEGAKPRAGTGGACAGRRAHARRRRRLRLRFGTRVRIVRQGARGRDRDRFRFRRRADTALRAADRRESELTRAVSDDQARQRHVQRAARELAGAMV